MAAISLNHLLHSVADAGMDILRRGGLGRKQERASAISWCHDLLSTKGEASGVAIARQIVDAYDGMTADEKRAFLGCLRDEFHVDPEAILAEADAFRKNPAADSLLRLIHEVEPRRQELFRRINMAPNGTQALVNLRRDLLSFLHQNPDFQVIDADLAHLLSSWFNRGFLTLRQIDWHTPAAILERLMAYETVHAMRGWDDLRRRMGSDRRCFAFFHGALPNDPLIFVEVALVKGIADAIGPLVDPERPEIDSKDADTAIFFSINNCHSGLKGIAFGQFLIKQVMLELQRELPQLKTFATLSPIPGFRKWLRSARTDLPEGLITEREAELLDDLDGSDGGNSAETLNVLKPVLLRLVTYYLLCAKDRGEPLDPVARFHLRNGARLERINWMADPSPNGIERAAGLLVNYRYQLDDIERNHEAYVEDHVIVATAAVTKNLPTRFR